MEPPSDELNARTMRDAAGHFITGARTSTGCTRWSTSKGRWKSAKQEGGPFHAGSL